MPLDISQITVAEIVSISPCSTRLNNAFAKAKRQGHLSMVTHGHCRERSTVVSEFGQLHSLGETSLNELERLIDRWATASRRAYDALEFSSMVGASQSAVTELFEKHLVTSTAAPSRTATTESFKDNVPLGGVGNSFGLDSIRSLKISTLVEISECSVGLQNAIRRDTYGNLTSQETIGSFINNRRLSRELLLKIQAFGRKKLFELERIIDSWCEQARKASNLREFAEFLGVSYSQLAEHLDEGASSGTDGKKIIADSNVPQRPLHIEDPYLASHRERLVQIVCEQVKNVEISTIGLKYDISNRLRNALEAIESREQFYEFNDLGIFLNDISAGSEKLGSLSNSGIVTIEELRDLVHEWMDFALAAAELPPDLIRDILQVLFHESATALTHDEIDEVESQLEAFDFADYAASSPSVAQVLRGLKLNDADQLNSTELSRMFLRALLPEREFDVLVARNGLFGHKRETLEEIAVRYGVTRERIRQIEKKTYGKCRLPGHLVVFVHCLTEDSACLRSILIGDAERLSVPEVEWRARQLPALSAFLLEVVYSGPAGWLDTCMKPIHSGENRLGWVSPSADVDLDWQAAMGEAPSDRSALKAQILAAIDGLSWPITVPRIAEQLPEASPDWVRSVLENELEARVEGELVRFVKVPHRLRLIWVLRDAGRGLTISDVVARHLKLFGFEIESGTARNVLGNLPDALIVARGTYNLYENLPIPAHEIRAIADICHQRLVNSPGPLSAKKLYQLDFRDSRHFEQYKLNHYIILGILQDDDRFSVGTGLMVGLKGRATFSSLHDDILAIVQRDGPIRISEIKKKLQATRDVLEVSIAKTIDDSDQILAVDTGIYDLANRIFENDDEYHRIRTAIKINLLDAPRSPFSLQELLGAVGISINQHTLRALAKSDSEIGYARNLISLEAMPDWLARYANRRITADAGDEVAFGDSRGDRTDDPELTELANLDAGMQARIAARKGSDAEGGGQDGIIGKLLDDFGF